jgi:hypothetical protein
MHCVSESAKGSSTSVHSTVANPPPQALAHTSVGEVVLSLLLTVTAREYRSAVAQDYPKPANQVVLPGCITNTPECNSVLHTANSVPESLGHGDQVMNTRTRKRSVSGLSGRNNVMPDSEMLSQYNSDFSNMTKSNGSAASRTDIDSDVVTGSTVRQFGLTNRHAWKHYANRTHISGFATKTERNARSRRHSAIAADLDSSVINSNITAKNVSKFRTHKLEVPNNKVYFHNTWKNLVKQNRTFSTNKSQIQEKLLLHSAQYVGADDRSANDSSFVVQKRVKRDTEDETVDSVTTMTEVNSISEHGIFRHASEPEQCPALEYIVYTWVLCLVALATALKLYYLVKTTLAAAMVSVFITLYFVASSGR